MTPEKVLRNEKNTPENLEVVIAGLEFGGEFWVVVAPYTFCWGAGTECDTDHYLITANSNPITHLTFEENRKLDVVRSLRDEDVAWVRPIIKQVDTVHDYWNGVVIYVGRKPFKVWVRKRGYWKTESEDDDYVIVARKVVDPARFIDILRNPVLYLSDGAWDRPLERV